jgi:glycosyltransferase involved in cell wall biosynthesis
MQQALISDRPPLQWLISHPNMLSADKKRIYLIHHFPGDSIFFDGQNYIAYDGIPRVMRMVVQTINKYPDYEIIVTARMDQAASFYGYFNSLGKQQQQIRVMVIDDQQVYTTILGKYRKFKSTIKMIVRRSIPNRYLSSVIKFKPCVVSIISFFENIFQRAFLFFRVGVKQCSSHNQVNQYVRHINDDPNCHIVLVPHYYWFPETLHLKKNIYLYLPDYMPHFFHDTGEFSSDEGVHTQIGKQLAQKAVLVLCNSKFTKGYLPESRLKVDQKKIRVFYLPNLNQNTMDRQTVHSLPDDLSPYNYLFYPVQPRANKNMYFLLQVFEVLSTRHPHIKLVLTKSLEANPKAYKLYTSLSEEKKTRILFKENISDDLMLTLYKNAALLCFTSLAEGNFPPQIQEALAYEAPIVASDLGFITERIPVHLKDSLLLCQPNHLDGFVQACETVLRNRNDIIEKQKLLHMHISEQANQFETNVLNIFN